MADEAANQKRLYRFGAVAFLVSAVLLSGFGLLERLAGPPPASGAEILAWAEGANLWLALEVEVLFFVLVALVPAVVALYRSLAAAHPLKAMFGSGVFALVLPLLAAAVIVLGRLPFPVFGIHLTAPDSAALVVALFYGGLHAVDLLLAGAIFVFSLAMRRETTGWLGFAAVVGELAVAYPAALGPALSLGCRVLLAVWMAAVGWRLLRLK